MIKVRTRKVKKERNRIILICIALFFIVVLLNLFIEHPISKSEAIKRAQQLTSVEGVYCSGYRCLYEGECQVVFRDGNDNVVDTFLVFGSDVANDIYHEFN